MDRSDFQLLSLVVLEGLEKLSCLAGFSFQTLSSLPAG